MPRTTIYGVYDGGTYGAVERVADHLPVPGEHQPRQRSWRIVAKRAVLASGAIERGIAFAGNDLPGVMLGSAVRSYLNRFGVAPGTRAVVFTASDDGWATARDLAASGVAVAAVVDPRKEGFEKQGAGPWPVFAGAVVKEARGGQQLRSRHRARRQGRRDRDRLRSARSVEWLESHAASDLPSRRQAGLAGGACRIRSRVQAQGHERGRRRGRSSLPRRGACKTVRGLAQRLRAIWVSPRRCRQCHPSAGKSRISPRRCGGCVAARARPSSICRTT